MDYGKIWIISTTILISFIGFSSQLFIILPFHNSNSNSNLKELLNLLIPFNLLLFSVFLNYYLCIFTNPGEIPKNWSPDLNNLDNGQVEVKKLNGQPRYCKNCKAYKPPRSHHCRKCKKCIKKMDHHCPWINNCVGFENHGHFIRFLFSVDVACSYHLWMISTRAFGITAFSIEPTTTQIIMLVLNYTTCVPVLIAVGMFSIFHFWSICSNTTTIENWEKDKVAVLKRKGRIREVKFPYHLGILKNLKSVLGENIFFWCLPQTMKGDGLNYPVAIGLDSRSRTINTYYLVPTFTHSCLDQSSQYTWPPKDKFLEQRQMLGLDDTQQHRRSRRRKELNPNESPFTYGTGLNPNLISTSSASSAGMRNRNFNSNSYSDEIKKPRRVKYTPYQQQQQSNSSSSSSLLLSEEEEEDSIPLSTLASRRNQTNSSQSSPPPLMNLKLKELDPPIVVRVRRGSEGFEVKPIVSSSSSNREFDHENYYDDGNQEEEEEEWDQMSQSDDEGSDEFDQDGDRIFKRDGVGRYNVYIPEIGSGSEDEEEDEEIEIEVEEREGGNDSMDEYLEENTLGGAGR